MKSESRKLKAVTRAAIELPPEDRFFTKPELARLLKVSVRCITDMMRRGELPYLKINGKNVRFRLQDVTRRLGETVLFCEAYVEPRMNSNGHENQVRPPKWKGHEEAQNAPEFDRR